MLTALYFISSLFFASIGIQILQADRKSMQSRLLFVICVNLTFWAAMFVMMSTASTAEMATLYRSESAIAWSLVYSLILHFIMNLTKNDHLIKRPWALGILYAPAAICLYLNYIREPILPSEIVRTKMGWTFVSLADYPVIRNVFFNAYYSSYILLSLILLANFYRKSENRREKKQAKIIFMTILAAAAIGSVTDVILPLARTQLMPPMGIVSIAIPIGGFWYAIKKYKLINLYPENTVQDILRIMKEGLIIYDNNNLISQTNKGAMQMLGFTNKEMTGQPISSFFMNDFEMDKLIDQSSKEVIAIQKSGQKIPVLLSSTSIVDDCGQKIGNVAIFQDLTEVKSFQEQLAASHDALEIKVSERTHELRKANSVLKAEIEKRKQMEKKIQNMAMFDLLTGLPNRRLFYDQLGKAIAFSSRSESMLAVLYLDLDSFKRINDTLGHTNGDELLRQVAKRLVSITRKGDTVSRMGGDEFLMIFPGIQEPNDIEQIAVKIQDALHKPYILENNEIYISTSIGGAIFPMDGEDIGTLVKNADIAMYKAKGKGANKIVFCTEKLKESSIESLHLTNNLYRAIHNEEFELYYQPQVNAPTGKVIGLEALIRWNNPELGLMSPIHFIPLAEKTGLILTIGEWVVRTACRQLKEWKDAGLPIVPVAVNLSVNQFQNTKIVEQIMAILCETELDPHFLDLEITESALMVETDNIIDILVKLREQGIKISIDDFGIEYSSLSYLKQLPIDQIKIDMSFIRGIGNNSKDEAIINAIIQLAQDFNLSIIAEGVENSQQLDFLLNKGCEKLQGYYFYKPMDAEQMEQVLRNLAAADRNTVPKTEISQGVL